MGKITGNVIDYINDTVKRESNTKYSSYARFTDNAPVFLTYYQQNKIESTQDEGLGNVFTNIGDESSTKFNKIEHVPMVAVDKSSLDLDVEDMRIKATFEGSGTILPNTIKPIPGDYFSFEYMENRYLFKVTGISTDTIKGAEYFYKVQYKFDREDERELFDQISESYICLYEKIGTEESSVIVQSDYRNIETLESMFEDISKEYLNMFFDKRSDSLVLRNIDGIDEYYLYDPYLTKFVEETKLFEKEYSFNSTTIRQNVNPVNTFNKKYLFSIFNSILKRRDIDEIFTKFRKLIITDIMTYYYRSPDRYYEIELKDKNDLVDLFPLTYIDDNIKSRINNSIKFDNDSLDNIFLNIVFYYIKKQDDLIEDYIINNIEDIYMENTIVYFIFTPIVLFILRNIIDNIRLKDKQ